MTAAFPEPAWLVGCGNMAGAMVEGWRAGGVDFSGVSVIRPSGTPVEGVRTVTDYPNERPRFVMLGFKPQKLDEIALGLARHVGTNTVLVSMLAGVTAATLRQRFPEASAIVRVMPNLPVAQQRGVVALFNESEDRESVLTVGGLMSELGLAFTCGDEQSFAAIGAVAGAGPAYVARFADAMARGGEKLGLDATTAEVIAVQTLVGTGALIEATGASMADVARRVASPKGTTEQGLAVLDAADGLRPLVEKTLAAAFRRGQELAEETARRD